MNETNATDLAAIQQRLERYLSMLGCTPEASVAVLTDLTGEFADSATEAEILEAAFARLNAGVVGGDHANPAAMIHFWVTQGGAGEAVDSAEFEHRAWCYPPITRTLMAPPRRRQAAQESAASTVKTA